ncbi:chitin disaccharide deacetylase [Metabacillus hrfriensis]|uniref:Chitin disaccharide deacetylase n=1 Tax=Metabacillus hrfriensis TaxID=3048891 RepID=A0ACD4RDN1_9BACI|nr:chitin disaccharide deacetylase [Metabacillus sp. CT-WN-B3]WHZ58479.1 chitin disaccharide deacetylase [Metabacillus sp. CT-WN-B3]
MPHFIINADDFGYSRGVNYGIIDAHTDGIVNSATMMVNMPGAQHAVSLAKEHPELQVGIHLTLTCGRAASDQVPSLIDDNGYFNIKNDPNQNQNINAAEVEIEWETQIQRFLSFGLAPSHLDSHHHVHSWPVLEQVIMNLANKYDLPVRRFWEGEKEGLQAFSDVFVHTFYGDDLSPDYFTELKKSYQGDIRVEIMCHPAYIDEALLKGSSYCLQRSNELSILMAARRI